MADAFESTFGHRPIAHHDDRPEALDGFFDAKGEGLYVNLSRPERSVGFTVFHEMQHLVRDKATKGDAQAKTATQMLDQVWGMISQEDKDAYATRPVPHPARQRNDDHAAGAAGPAAARRDAVRLHGQNTRTTARSWRGLAKNHPTKFGAFAQRWLDALNRLIAALRGNLGRSARMYTSSPRAADRAKVVVEDAAHLGRHEPEAGAAAGRQGRAGHASCAPSRPPLDHGHR